MSNSSFTIDLTLSPTKANNDAEAGIPFELKHPELEGADEEFAIEHMVCI